MCIFKVFIHLFAFLFCSFAVTATLPLKTQLNMPQNMCLAYLSSSTLVLCKEALRAFFFAGEFNVLTQGGPQANQAQGFPENDIERYDTTNESSLPALHFLRFARSLNVISLTQLSEKS